MIYKGAGGNLLRLALFSTRMEREAFARKYGGEQLHAS